MIIALYTSGVQYMPAPELRQWLDVMERHSIECYFNCDFALSIENRTKMNIKSYCSIEDLPSGVELVISYGGDGTFLKCVNLFFETGIPMLGVNSGRLGFLAAVPKEDVERFISDIVEGNYSIEERALLYCEELDVWALNECTIQKRGLSMLDIDLSVDEECVANYMADGVLVSTPTGSTAYSLSVGGAIVSPQCDCLMINPLAPHNLNLRPLVVSGQSYITVEARSRNNDLFATFDNREYTLPNPAKLTLTKSDKRVTLVKLPYISFYETLRKKLMWGMDTRNK